MKLDAAVRKSLGAKPKPSVTKVQVTSEGFKLLERAPGVSVEAIQNATEGHLIIEGVVPEMVL